MTTLEAKIKELPPALQQEVYDFVSFLLEKKCAHKREKPLFEWAGALSDMKEKYTSVELQHKMTTDEQR